MNSDNNNNSGNNNSPIYTRSTCEEQDDMPELIECFDNVADLNEYLDNNSNYVNTRGGVEIPDIINYFNDSINFNNLFNNYATNIVPNNNIGIQEEEESLDYLYGFSNKNEPLTRQDSVLDEYEIYDINKYMNELEEEEREEDDNEEYFDSNEYSHDDCDEEEEDEEDEEEEEDQPLTQENIQNGFLNSETNVWHIGRWETDETGRLIFYPLMEDVRNIKYFGSKMKIE